MTRHRRRFVIPWREKFRAFSIHFAATLVVAAAAAALIFLVWYPPPFGTMVGGLKLFTLITGIDLALGPLVSLVIYDSRKSRRALVFDYTVVAVVQAAALAYGIYSVSQARPAYVAFVKDRLEVIAAGEIAEQDWREAKGSTYASAPKYGPELVATHVKPADSNDALDGGLQGRDVGVRPKFYVEYDSKLDAIKRQLKPLSSLEQHHPESAPLVAESLRELGRPADDLGWLPVRHSRGFWTALVDRRSGYPVKYLPIDPY
jgi:hypothetical protein